LKLEKKNELDKLKQELKILKKGIAKKLPLLQKYETLRPKYYAKILKDLHETMINIDKQIIEIEKKIEEIINT
jgi:predicted  nucleic acid-binding Zn-ribbon protein